MRGIHISIHRRGFLWNEKGFIPLFKSDFYLRDYGMSYMPLMQ